MKPSTSSRVRNNRTDIWTLRTKSKPVNGRIVSVFTLIQQSHEMYVMGHYIEAAVAYHEVTGNQQALDVACRMADCIDANFGPEDGKIHGADGHPEIELALAKLYDATGEERYLNLARYLIDGAWSGSAVLRQADRRCRQRLHFPGSGILQAHVLPSRAAGARAADR